METREVTRRSTLEGRTIQENEIVFFRYRSRLLAGICHSTSGGKIRFSTPGQGSVSVPAENVLLATDATAADAREAAKWWDAAVADGEGIDLEEIWDLVREEGEAWPLEGLSELYHDGEATPKQLAALLVHLEDSRYFEGCETAYRPLSEDEVAERREAEAREAARAEERLRFRRWFNDRDDAVDVQDAAAAWLARLQDYVLQGEKSTHAQWVRRMAGEEVNARRVFRRLVDEGVWDADEHLDLMRKGVPIDFSGAVLRAADTVSVEDLLNDTRRRDLTSVPVVTIDDSHTTDRDDGLSIVWDDDGTCRVGIHITDVATLIPGGSELDQEALNRVSSLYFPDRRIAMFPPAISEGIGSLHPDVPCLALSVCLEVADDGSVGDAEIFPSIIRCAEKLTYEEADAALEDAAHPLHLALGGLRRVAQTHCGKRLRDGAISLERTERVVRVAPDGEITVATRVRTSPANFLVSEFMIMANVAIARFCQQQGIPTVYRSQVAPDFSDLEETDNEILNRYRILRRMKPASVSLDPEAHGGLGVDLYCQASSPLRRYPDLAIQRQVLAALMGDPLPYDAEGIQDVLFQADERIREIGRLEGRRERYWLYRYLERSIGETFEAVVLDSWGRGSLVEIVEYGLRADVKPAAPVAEGDAIVVRLTRTDPWGDSVQFTHVS